jgi:hypothetical protein
MSKQTKSNQTGHNATAFRSNKGEIDLEDCGVDIVILVWLLLIASQKCNVVENLTSSLALIPEDRLLCYLQPVYRNLSLTIGIKMKMSSATLATGATVFGIPPVTLTATGAGFILEAVVIGVIKENSLDLPNTDHVQCVFLCADNCYVSVRPVLSVTLNSTAWSPTSSFSGVPASAEPSNVSQSGITRKVNSNQSPLSSLAAGMYSWLHLPLPM